MAKQSAGILLYRNKNGVVEVFLGHPGGPFFVKKDDGVWSIPKGEYKNGENPLQAAQREFQEEIGKPVPAKKFLHLGSVKLSGGKTIYAWAAKGEIDENDIKSNSFSIEWPPKSGQKQEFPEIDRAGWFSLPRAANKLSKSQVVFLERLAELLKIKFTHSKTETLIKPKLPEQPTLF